ncbi:MAG: endonuclease V [Crinalium sp.]
MTIFAVDVDYRQTYAAAAGVMFNNWEDSRPNSQSVIRVDEIAEYEPGYFYKRELPCLLKLLDELNSLPEYIIVDGYVYLDGIQQAGLGKHLYDAIEGKSIVIGVAKTRFKDISGEFEVFRSNSQRPLYVTAIGISNEAAKSLIEKMHGQYRIPTMLKIVDKLSKQTQ